MKRFYAILISFVLLLGLCACAGKYPDLIKYEIITKEETNRGEFITYLEALEAVWNIENLYDGETVRFQDFGVSSFGDLSADTQEKLSKLINDIYGPFLSLDELKIIDYAANLTRYKALVYATRLIPAGGSCVITGPVDPLSFSTPGDTYRWARKIGLISEIDFSTVDEPIRREEFYMLLEKTMQIPYTSGTYSPITASILERMFYKEEKGIYIPPNSRQIPAQVYFLKDLQVAVLPLDPSLEEYDMAAYAIDHDGNVHMIFYCPAIEDHIRYRELMDYIFSELLEMHGDIEKIHLHYIPQDEYDPLKTEYLYLEFNLPEIKYVQEGKPVEPGTITWLNDPNDRAKKSYTLRGGASLEPDCYYLLSSRPRDTFETKDEPLFWFSGP